MALYKKATPGKSETRVVPDEQDGTIPFVKSQASGGFGGASDDAPGAEAGTETGSQPGQLSVDVFQTADEIVVVAPVAGVKPENLEITITDEILEIQGRRNFQFRVEDADYFTRECFWGPFSRTVILPDAVDTGRVTASFKNGILTVRIPKISRVKTRVVKIVESD